MGEDGRVRLPVQRREPKRVTESTRWTSEEEAINKVEVEVKVRVQAMCDWNGEWEERRIAMSDDQMGRMTNMTNE